MATCPSCGFKFDSQSLATIWVDETLLALCNRAHALAEQQSTLDVRIAHVLFSIAIDDHGRVALQRFGIAAGHLIQLLTVRFQTQYVPRPIGAGLNTAAELRALLERTKQQALVEGRHLITIEDFLTTLMKAGDTLDASCLLQQAQIQVQNQVQAQQSDQVAQRWMAPTGTRPLDAMPRTGWHDISNQHFSSAHASDKADRQARQSQRHRGPDARHIWQTHGETQRSASFYGDHHRDASARFHDPQQSQVPSEYSLSLRPVQSPDQTPHSSEPDLEMHVGQAVSSAHQRGRIHAHHHGANHYDTPGRQRPRQAPQYGGWREGVPNPGQHTGYHRNGWNGSDHRHGANTADQNWESSDRTDSRPTSLRNPPDGQPRAFSENREHFGDTGHTTRSKDRHRSRRSHWRTRLRVRRRTSQKRVSWQNRRRLSHRARTRHLRNSMMQSRHQNWTPRDTTSHERYDLEHRQKYEHTQQHRPSSDGRWQDRQRISDHGQTVQRDEDDTPRFYLAIDDDIVDAPSIGPKTATRLNRVGLHSVRDLLDCDPDAIANALNSRHITAARIVAWQKQASLVCTIPELRGTHAQLFVGAGLETPEDITAMDAGTVCSTVLRFAATKEGQSILRSGAPPPKERIRTWVENAARAEPQRVA